VVGEWEETQEWLKVAIGIAESTSCHKHYAERGVDFCRSRHLI
jgi:hypothetical protein